MTSLGRGLLLENLLVLDITITSGTLHYKDSFVRWLIDREKNKKILDLVAEAVVRDEKLILICSGMKIYYPVTTCRIGRVKYQVYMSDQYRLDMYLVPLHVQSMISTLLRRRSLINTLVKAGFIRNIYTSTLNPVLRKAANIVDIDVENGEYRDGIIRGIVYWSLHSSYSQDPESTIRFIETLSTYGKESSDLLNFMVHTEAIVDAPLDRFASYIIYLPFYHNISLITESGMLHIYDPVTIADRDLPYSLTCLVVDDDLVFYPSSAYARKDDYVMGTPILSREDRSRLTLFKDIIPRLENLEAVIDKIVEIATVSREGGESLRSRIRRLVGEPSRSIFLPVHPLSTILPNSLEKLIELSYTGRGGRMRIYSPDGVLEVTEVKFKLGVEKYRITLS